MLTIDNCLIFAARCMQHGLCRHAVSVSLCVSVCLSRSWIMSKRINIIFEICPPSGSHTILVFPYQTYIAPYPKSRFDKSNNLILIANCDFWPFDGHFFGSLRNSKEHYQTSPCLDHHVRRKWSPASPRSRFHEKHKH